MDHIYVTGFLALLSLLDPGVRGNGLRLQEGADKGEGQRIKGERHADEVENGVSLQQDHMIRFEYSGNQGLPATNFKYIRVGFITRKKQGILVQVRGKTDSQYFSLEMNNIGGMRFFIDVGWERWEFNTELGIDLTDGRAHEVTMQNFGQTVSLQVDDYDSAVNWLPESMSESIQNNPGYLFIGNNGTTARGFEGCIYGVQVDNIYPLKLALQDPMPSYVLFTVCASGR